MTNVLEEHDLGGKEFLRAKDLARLLDVTTESVRKWMRNGLIPSVTIGGSNFIPVDELRELLERRSRGGENDGE